MPISQANDIIYEAIQLENDETYEFVQVKNNYVRYEREPSNTSKATAKEIHEPSPIVSEVTYEVEDPLTPPDSVSSELDASEDKIMTSSTLSIDKIRVSVIIENAESTDINEIAEDSGNVLQKQTKRQ